MKYLKFWLDVFILLSTRMEFEKKILNFYDFYFLKFEIIYFIYLLNKKKLIKVKDIISINIFHIYIYIYSKNIYICIARESERWKLTVQKGGK